MSTLNYGDLAAQEVSQRIAAPLASLALLKSVPATRRTNGQMVRLLDDGSRWQFNASSALAGDDQLVVAPDAGGGRWLRDLGMARLRMPFAFDTADAAVLLTVPAGCLLQPIEFFWEVTANFTGGTSSTIGVSSNKTGYSTKGNLLGGAAGDAAAALTTALSPNVGTIGANWATIANRRVLWIPTDTFRFDRITSAFTAGTGFVNAIVNILRHAGA